MDKSSITYNDQSNKARYVYAISKEPSIDYPFCHMYNNLFIYKRPRSDEKCTYNERIIYTVIRTIAFQLIFKQGRYENDIKKIIYTGTVVWIDATFETTNRDLPIRFTNS